MNNNSKKPDNIVWIEEVLINNLENLERSSNSNAVESDASPGAENGPAQNPSSVSANQQSGESLSPPSCPVDVEDGTGSGCKSHQSISSVSNLELKVGIAEIELKDESFLGDNRVTTLSRIVTGKIKYFVENRDADEERYQYWLLKLPSLINPQRQLSQTINAAKREIAFYTEILPEMKSWLQESYEEAAQKIEFRVPTCFYGKYQRQIDQDPDLDIITHILDSESLLVLDDLRASGFGKRHFGSGLIISEATAAIEEIVKFHVVSWAMTQIDKRRPAWPDLYDWQRLSHLYYTLLENNWPSVQNFLLKDSPMNLNSKEVFGKVSKLRTQLLNVFMNLLMPAEHPLPNTLVHMDLWSENILFRVKEQDKDDGVPLEKADLDCYILDWQMVTFGRPTHDLALLIMLSMDPEYRREHTTPLLQYYYELFKKTAGYFNLEVPFDFHMLLKEYKRSCILATLMAMASIDVVLLEESTQHRLLEALMDLIDEKLI